MQHAQRPWPVGEDLGDALAKQKLGGVIHCREVDSERVGDDRSLVTGSCILSGSRNLIPWTVGVSQVLQLKQLSGRVEGFDV